MGKAVIKKCDRCRRDAKRLHTVIITRSLDYNGRVESRERVPYELCGECYKPFNRWLGRRTR